MGIDNIINEINNALGEGTITTGSDPKLKTRFLPTGVLPVDFILGGGLPAGRFTEVYGDYSSLKSFIALKALGSVQAMGGKVAIVDTEHSYSPEWAEHLGVNTDELLLQHPPTAEDAIAVMEVLIRNKFDLVVWDSIAASQPRQYEQAKPGDDKSPAALARVMSNGLRRLNSVNSSTAVLAINQTRVNVGMTYGGARDTVPGGKSMPFYASYRMRMTKAGRISEDVQVHDGERLVKGRNVVAMKIKMTLEKSKLSKPNKETWFLFDLHGGFTDDDAFLVSQGVEQGVVIDKRGRFTIPGKLDKSIHGRAKFLTYVRDNSEVREWLEEKVMGTEYLESLGRPRSADKKKGGRRKKKS